MAYLVDTNVILRWVQRRSPECPIAVRSLKLLRRQQETLYLSPQNFIEFWNAATRPLAVNGLGFMPTEAHRQLRRFERIFRLAPDAPAIFDEWKHLVVSCGVSGIQVHDTRLVAVMAVYGITHLLTFDTADFQRFPGIVVVHPKDVP